MTIKDEYNMMKSCFRIWNGKSNYDDTPYIYFVEHYTKKAQSIFMKLLQSDMDKLNFEISKKIITIENYNRKMKILSDCERSILNMNII